MNHHGWSERRACLAMGLSRSTARYRRRPDRDEKVIALLAELAERFPERGFDKLFQLIRRRGLVWNHKRVWRVYCLMQLNRRRRGKKRVPNRHPMPLVAGEQINSSWSIDFMSDALWDGRRFRTFNVLDDFSREALAIEIDLNLPATRVIRTLERIAAWRGYPTKLRLERVACPRGTMAQSLLRWRWPSGQNAKASRWTSSSRAGRCRTASSNASMAACGAASSICTSSAISPKYVSRPSSGWPTTTPRFPTTALAGCRPPNSAFRTTRQPLI